MNEIRWILIYLFWVVFCITMAILDGCSSTFGG